jgi:hypothetical protein
MYWYRFVGLRASITCWGIGLFLVLGCSSSGSKQDTTSRVPADTGGEVVPDTVKDTAIDTAPDVPTDLALEMLADTAADVPADTAPDVLPDAAADVPTDTAVDVEDDGVVEEDTGVDACAPQCESPSGDPLQCGNDGCGGVCGQCSEYGAVDVNPVVQS